MKFDSFRSPREQVVPLTFGSAFRNYPYRATLCKNPFLGVFFTVGFVVLPYLFHKLDQKIGMEEGRKKLKAQLRERKRHHVGGEVQFHRDYEYAKHHLLNQWEKENK
uniref:Uncharacterized protein n=1 Tax=Trichuris muris TaxID=70415 RepID=A0A5S6R3Y2_TRIMR